MTPRGSTRELRSPNGLKRSLNRESSLNTVSLAGASWCIGRPRGACMNRWCPTATQVRGRRRGGRVAAWRTPAGRRRRAAGAAAGGFPE
jgi:hypothetical protein